MRELRQVPDPLWPYFDLLSNREVTLGIGVGGSIPALTSCDTLPAVVIDRGVSVTVSV